MVPGLGASTGRPLCTTDDIFRLRCGDEAGGGRQTGE